MTRCRPGDIALVIGAGPSWSCDIRGLIVTVATAEASPFGPFWHLASAPRCPYCRQVIRTIFDHDLQPIRPAPQQSPTSIEQPVGEVVA